MRTMIDKCPVCDNDRFAVAKLICAKCGTAIEGKFSLSKLGGLATEHQDFIEVFIRCRGNIKDVERELGISYPTVRNRLDKVIRALGYATENASKRRQEILIALEKQEMTAEEAAAAIREIS